MTKPETFAGIWDAAADPPQQAANLRARSELMEKIAARRRPPNFRPEFPLFSLPPPSGFQSRAHRRATPEVERTARASRCASPAPARLPKRTHFRPQTQETELVTGFPNKPIRTPFPPSPSPDFPSRPALRLAARPGYDML